MNCRRFKRLLPGYLYGELSAGARERFVRHSAACPACRRLREEMEETVSRLAPVPGSVFSRGEKDLLRERVRSAVRSAASAPRTLPDRDGLRILFRPLLLPAALAAAVLLLVLLRTPDDPPSAPAEAAALAALSEEVEEEFQLFADVWGEIEEIESLFSPDPGTGAGAEIREGDEFNLA
jgi:anti-sigma factor RsiW